ncbi:uncharacterized protein LAESUDRAFT_361815 [Laetiporus sulphureus 93-53]|uniref:Uncharacterized protein n=1 Tax=Laetiporus sulphureus 93-53 TaxID=1314785 RepID=A0A165GZ50_9APHY|nr:uncharacterized protein LAESUDRAFT_361815 [Laetiporus sulphureus 93-53]KZT11029.1 hypothetical protein LAESUDRAFT_361815 [Laetiporus sulphureus 93-53]
MSVVTALITTSPIYYIIIALPTVRQRFDHSCAVLSRHIDAVGLQEDMRINQHTKLRMVGAIHSPCFYADPFRQTVHVCQGSAEGGTHERAALYLGAFCPEARSP